MIKFGPYGCGIFLQAIKNARERDRRTLLRAVRINFPTFGICDIFSCLVPFSQIDSLFA